MDFLPNHLNVANTLSEHPTFTALVSVVQDHLWTQSVSIEHFQPPELFEALEAIAGDEHCKKWSLPFVDIFLDTWALDLLQKDAVLKVRMYTDNVTMSEDWSYSSNVDSWLKVVKSIEAVMSLVNATSRSDLLKKFPRVLASHYCSRISLPTNEGDGEFAYIDIAQIGDLLYPIVTTRRPLAANAGSASPSVGDQTQTQQLPSKIIKHLSHIAERANCVAEALKNAKRMKTVSVALGRMIPTMGPWIPYFNSSIILDASSEDEDESDSSSSSSDCSPNSIPGNERFDMRAFRSPQEMARLESKSFNI